MPWEKSSKAFTGKIVHHEEAARIRALEVRARARDVHSSGACACPAAGHAPVAGLGIASQRLPTRGWRWTPLPSTSRRAPTPPAPCPPEQVRLAAPVCPRRRRWTPLSSTSRRALTRRPRTARRPSERGAALVWEGARTPRGGPSRQCCAAALAGGAPRLLAARRRPAASDSTCVRRLSLPLPGRASWGSTCSPPSSACLATTSRCAAVGARSRGARPAPPAQARALAQAPTPCPHTAGPPHLRFLLLPRTSRCPQGDETEPKKWASTGYQGRPRSQRHLRQEYDRLTRFQVGAAARGCAREHGPCSACHPPPLCGLPLAPCPPSSPPSPLPRCAVGGEEGGQGGGARQQGHVRRPASSTLAASRHARGGWQPQGHASCLSNGLPGQARAQACLRPPRSDRDRRRLVWPATRPHKASRQGALRGSAAAAALPRPLRDNYEMMPPRDPRRMHFLLCSRPEPNQRSQPTMPPRELPVPARQKHSSPPPMTRPLPWAPYPPRCGCTRCSRGGGAAPRRGAAPPAPQYNPAKCVMRVNQSRCRAVRERARKRATSRASSGRASGGPGRKGVRGRRAAGGADAAGAAADVSG